MRILMGALALAWSAGVVLGQTCPIHALNGSEISASISYSAFFQPPGAAAPRLIVTGRFARLGPVRDSGMAQWKNGGWAAVEGAPQRAGPIAGGVDAQGPALFVLAGGMQERIWRYDGTSWSQIAILPPAGSGDWVVSMVVFDADGAGPLPPRLYVLRRVDDDHVGGGASSGNVAYWDGAQWHGVGDYLPNRAIAAYGPAGQSEQLYVTGSQSWSYHSSHQVLSRVMRLDPSGWTEVGMINDRENVHESGRMLEVHEGPGGERVLILGGRFSKVRADGVTVPAANIAAWNGTQWSALGEGLPGRTVISATTYNFDSGGAGQPVLVAASGELAVWDGTAWSEFPGVTLGGSHVRAFRDDAPGAEGTSLVVSGALTVMERTAPGVTVWDGEGWSDLLDGPGGPVLTLAVMSEGGAERLIAGGRFRLCGELEVNNAAVWDGLSWSALGTGIEPVAANMTPLVVSSAVHDDGSGSALYVGGLFRSAGGVPVFNMARYAQGAWHAVGDGLGGGAPRALAVHDDGTGKRLYAGGAFHSSGWTQIRRLAVWDGTAWSEVAGGVETDGAVWALASWDSGSGPALYVGGSVMSAGGLGENLGFRLRGGMWEALPDLRRPLAGDEGRINAFAVHDDGYGERMYALGRHGQGTVARLESEEWVGLRRDLPWSYDDEVFAGRSVVDCEGSALHVPGRRFTRNGGAFMQYRPAGRVRAMSPPFNDGNGEAVFVAGEFARIVTPLGSNAVAESEAASRIARLPLRACYANCDGSTLPPVLNVDDFLCFINQFAAAQMLPVAQQIEHYANCDGSTTEPVLTVDDFLCFIDRFAAGCP